MGRARGFFGFLGDGLLFLYWRWLVFLAGEQAQMSTGILRNLGPKSAGEMIKSSDKAELDGRFCGDRWVKFRMHPDGEEGSPRPPRALAKMLGEGAVLRDGEWQLPA